MSNESSNQQGKKPIRVDLQICYSGFKVEELEYIDYSRANAEPEDQFLNSVVSQLDYIAGTDTEDDENLGEGDFEETGNFAEYRSYLCSTPSTERKHRGSFPMDVELSTFNEFENQTDSGLQTRIGSLSGSIVSIFGEGESFAGSLENIHMARINKSAVSRKKIEIDPDIHNPYNDVGELELSIEEEISHMQYNTTTTLGTLRRRLSLKYFRRTTSTGLFGTYIQSTPNISSTPQMGTDCAPLLTKPTGPINLWFRKFRNRHFI